MIKARESYLPSIDWVTVIIFLVMIFLGWINIYAAVYNEEHSSILDLSQQYGKQLLWIITSIILAFVILLFDAKFFSVFAYVIYGILLLLLVLVLLVGKEVSGSRSWIEIGGVGIQPAEFMKFGTALAIAKYLSTTGQDLRSLTNLLKVSIFIIIPVILIELQNDTGTALVFLSFAFVFYRHGMPGIIIIAGAVILILFFLTLIINNLWIIGALSLIAIATLFMIKRTPARVFLILSLLLLSVVFVYSVDYAFDYLLKPHQQSRVKVLLGLEEDFLGAGYNVHQSLIAIGSGGLTGKGFLKGTQTKYNFVPEQSTDFIFCTVGEEWGFIGSVVVIGLFVWLLWRLIDIAERQRSDFSRIYGHAVFSLLFFHFAVNIAMTLGLFPVIGIPLPFFSYGGSSLWSFTTLLFVLLRLDSERTGIF